MYSLRFLKAFPIPSWAVGVGCTRALLPLARALPGKADFVTTHKPGHYTVCLGVIVRERHRLHPPRPYCHPLHAPF